MNPLNLWSRDIRWFVFSLFVLSMALTLIGAAFDLIFQTNYRPKMQAWQDQKVSRLDDYIRDKEYFAAHIFFQQGSSGNKDLADYMAARIAPEKEYVVVPIELQREAMALEHDWLERRYRLSAIPSAVVELFQRALSYDHWDIDKSLEIRPDLSASEFVVAGQLLLAHAVDSQEDIRKQALEKVRHFSSLLLSCENLNFKLAALSLLTKERHFTQFLSHRMPAKSVIWDHVSAADIERFRDHLYLTYDYLDFLTGAQVMEKVFLQDPIPVAFCSIFKLKYPVLARAAVYLQRQFPFEPAYGREYTSYTKIKELADKRCHKSHASLKATKDYSAFVPFLRRIVALRFLLNNKSLAEGI